MSKKSGFTLIELLAVIVILGILIAVTTVAVNNIRKKQDVKNRKNVISSILTGAKSYVSENNGVLDDLTETNPIMINVNDIKDDYADFDGQKYPEFVGKQVTVSRCSGENMKLRYEFTDALDGTTYNDCGCEAQQSNVEEASEELCVS